MTGVGATPAPAASSPGPAPAPGADEAICDPAFYSGAVDEFGGFLAPECQGMFNLTSVYRHVFVRFESGTKAVLSACNICQLDNAYLHLAKGGVAQSLAKHGTGLCCGANG